MSDATPTDRPLQPDEVRMAAEVAPLDAASDGAGTGDDEDGGDAGDAREAVTEPAKVMRIGAMVKQLLDEVHAAPLDEPSRERLAEIYERSVAELSMALSPDLQEELHMLALPFDQEAVPTEGELRIAKAQLVGWLEGLFHGIQATLMAQQFAARQQLEQMRELPKGPGGQPMVPGGVDRPGTYL